MTNRLTSIVVLSLALLIYGCSSPMKTPDIKQNPHPTKRYEITMTIDGAPGPFDSIEASAQYQVMNPRSVPSQPFSGATPTIGKSAAIVLTRMDGHVYKGTFYTDLMQDEDYFGMGLCHWELIVISAYLQVKKVTIAPALSTNDIASQKSVSRFFSNRQYFAAQNGEGNMFSVDTGESSPAAYKPEFQESLFSVTLVAKESFQ